MFFNSFDSIFVSILLFSFISAYKLDNPEQSYAYQVYVLLGNRDFPIVKGFLDVKVKNSNDSFRFITDQLQKGDVCFQHFDRTYPPNFWDNVSLLLTIKNETIPLENESNHESNKQINNAPKFIYVREIMIDLFTKIEGRTIKRFAPLDINKAIFENEVVPFKKTFG